jgi:hypothetical protein
MADADAAGQVTRLLSHLQSDDWRELWSGLQLATLKFADLNLLPSVPDAELWRLCQQEGIVLIMANRNEDGPDSLEATIKAENAPQSLPVFTLADPKRILSNSAYAERVAERPLEHLYNIDNLLGTGRLYLP